MPRLRPHVGGFYLSHKVSDRDMVHMMVAFRLFMPRAGITISTRESAYFRDNILRLGVTKMSAGVSTAVGDIYKGENTGQFDIADARTVEEMKEVISQLGYQPVFKDWQPI